MSTNEQTTTSTPPHDALGPFVACYGPRNRRWREAWIWPLPGFILAIILIITGFDWYYYGYTQYGPVAAQSWSQSWLAWGLSIGTITLCITIWQTFRSRVRIKLYRHGMEVKLPYHSLHRIRWDEVAGIVSATIQDRIWGFTIRSHHTITIQPLEGKPISLDDRIGNLPELATRLKANLYPRLLPSLRARFQDGQKISFGPISLQGDSIGIHNKIIMGESVDRITVISGYLVLDIHDHGTRQPQHIRIPVSHIPNLELFFQVLHR